MICLTNDRWDDIKVKLAVLRLKLRLAQSRERSRKDNLIEFLTIQADWSARTFGPGKRTIGLCNHIRSELDEIEQTPGDLEEWIDVIILALDATWRLGATPEEVVDTLMAKQQKNLKRSWGPPLPEDQPSFHLKE